MIEMSSRTIRHKIYDDLRGYIATLTEQGHKPTLGIVLVGDDPNSVAYVNVKQRQAEKLGMGFSLHRLDEQADDAAVLSVIDTLNKEATISGIIVQLPLPAHLDTDKILAAVAPEKDVDGLRTKSHFTPPTVRAILELLAAYDISLLGKNIVLVGVGRLVGGPLLQELKLLGHNVTTCDESTGDLGACTINADILVSATGQHHLIQPSMIKQGAVVIDVDHEVDYEKVLDKVGYITPQIGGIGPLTVAFLLSNTVSAALHQANVPIHEAE
jgi:methylenetetrahydrofolate dehydrogenase (NADP+)/methenyltetrahydrofolate cyclohydrolase